MIYLLLYKKQCLQPFLQSRNAQSEPQRHVLLAAEITKLLNQFGAALALANLTEDSFDGVLEVIKTETKKNKLCIALGKHPNLRSAKFKYEEATNSFEFFVPYIW